MPAANKRTSDGKLIGIGLQRFLERILISATSECWLWIGRRNSIHPKNGGQNYGRFDIGGTSEAAHRIAYEHFVGKIPEGISVLHKCDNPPCVNPEHLFLGTYSDNIRDAYAKGRGPKGYRRPKQNDGRPRNEFGRFLR